MLREYLISEVYASETSVPVTPIQPGVGITNIGELVTFIANILIIVGFALVVVMLAVGFVKYVTSQGEKSAVESAQKTLTYAVIGGVGLVLVYTLRTILVNLLGVDEEVINPGQIGGEE